MKEEGKGEQNSVTSKKRQSKNENKSCISLQARMKTCKEEGKEGDEEKANLRPVSHWHSVQKKETESNLHNFFLGFATHFGKVSYTGVAHPARKVVKERARPLPVVAF